VKLKPVPRANAEASEREAQEKAAADRAAAEKSEAEKQQLRARRLEQFNRVFPTKDTQRGLLVNMGDVLFDTGKSNLRPPAREALAKLSGIVLNYPSLRLVIEGHTDSTGSENSTKSFLSSAPPPAATISSTRASAWI
jgi:Outer membrane protein and related peptidoglycan-associated (lipo)proteins